MPTTYRHHPDQLERRLLLAAPATADYYPLTPTSRWEYAVVEDGGGADTLSVKVARGTRNISGEDASRVYYSEGSDRIQTFQNFTPKGQLHIHGGRFDDGSLILQRPITLPATLKPGTVKRSRGDVDLEYENFDGDGDYTATVRVGKERQVTVPAGTFSAVRVRVDIDFDAEEDIVFGEGPEADGHITYTMWLAKGVGVVRAELRYDVEADVVFDEFGESGSATQELRSYSIAPAPAAAANKRADRAIAVAAEAEDEQQGDRCVREADDLLA